MNLESCNSLLNQVALIKSKYDNLTEYTGENFNIFWILRQAESEATHSNFIANLLNPKAAHRQKDIFLKLFISEIESEFPDMFEKDSLPNSLKCKVFTEKYLGKVNYTEEDGGRIDIFITDGYKHLVIENKIWAKDQHTQLIRYNKAYPHSPLLYLTLDGSEPVKTSKGHLKNNKHFICISYKKHIVKWLENCIKEMANKPIIRESLNQYLNLVKQLTHQTPNNKMKEEVINLMFKNFEAAKLISENYSNAVEKYSLIQVKKLKEIIESKGINCNIERANRTYDGLFVSLFSFKIDTESDENKNGEFDLGVNFELSNNKYFFCVLRKGNKRSDKVNRLKKFDDIRNYLISKIPEANIHNKYTLGMANDYKIGIDRENYFYPDSDNTSAFEKVAEKILDFKKRLKE